jgi:hypothetical protein
MAFLARLLGTNETKAIPLPPQSQREPILAYRAWRISNDTLQSCTCDCLWDPRKRMEAYCNRNVRHRWVPSWDCQCGFYGYKSEEALAASGYVSMQSGETVQGRVALWGRVIDHELGYRAERAYPQLLYLCGNQFDDVVRRLAERYAIECMPHWLLTS